MYSAVGGLARHLNPVHIDDELHHAARTAVTHADVVDGKTRKNALTVANKFRAQHSPHVARALSLKKRRQKTFHVLKHNIRDETQTSSIDAHDRRTKGGQRTCHPQHGAVAA